MAAVLDAEFVNLAGARCTVLSAVIFLVLTACASGGRSVEVTPRNTSDESPTHRWLDAGSAREFAVIHDPSARPVIREYSIRAIQAGNASPGGYAASAAGGTIVVGCGWIGGVDDAGGEFGAIFLVGGWIVICGTSIVLSPVVGAVGAVVGLAVQDDQTTVRLGIREDNELARHHEDLDTVFASLAFDRALSERVATLIEQETSHIANVGTWVGNAVKVESAGSSTRGIRISTAEVALGIQRDPDTPGEAFKVRVIVGIDVGLYLNLDRDPILVDTASMRFIGAPHNYATFSDAHLEIYRDELRAARRQFARLMVKVRVSSDLPAGFDRDVGTRGATGTDANLTIEQIRSRCADRPDEALLQYDLSDGDVLLRCGKGGYHLFDESGNRTAYFRSQNLRWEYLGSE